LITLSYVDAHIHLTDPGYAGMVEKVVEEATAGGVTCLLSNGMDYESSARTLALAERYAGKVLAAVGIHPWTVTNANEPLDLKLFEEFVLSNRERITAIGEIGLDGQYTQDVDKKSKQHETFQHCLGLADRCKLPVMIHSRLAIDDVLNLLPNYSLTKVVLHWYSGPTEHLQLIRDRGYFITVGPSLLYSKRTQEIARTADLSIILTETDGPVNYYGPFKGKPTRPNFVIDVVNKLAEIKNENIDRVRDKVWKNFQTVISHKP